MPCTHLLALASLLHPTTGRLLVGGDHRQLPAITAYDASADLRPSFLRHSPFLTAYDYLLLLHRLEGEQQGLGLARGRCKGAAGGVQAPFMLVWPDAAALAGTSVALATAGV